MNYYYRSSVLGVPTWFCAEYNDIQPRHDNILNSLALELALFVCSFFDGFPVKLYKTGGMWK